MKLIGVNTWVLLGKVWISYDSRIYIEASPKPHYSPWFHPARFWYFKCHFQDYKYSYWNFGDHWRLVAFVLFSSISSSLILLVLYDLHSLHLPPKMWKGTLDFARQSLHWIRIFVSRYSSGIMYSSNFSSKYASNLAGLHTDFLQRGQAMLSSI